MNEVNRQIGNPAITDFDAARDFAVRELAGAFKGTASPSESDVKDMHDIVSGKMSPKQTQSVIEIAA